MVQDEKRAFGSDYSHSVADMPHTHHTLTESPCAQCAGLNGEVRRGPFFIALITTAATFSPNSPGCGSQTALSGLLARWSAALYETPFAISYNPLINLQSWKSSCGIARLCADSLKKFN